MDRKLYIDGRWVDAIGGDTAVIHDPATGDPVGTSAIATAADVDAAVAAATRAFPAWAAMHPDKRAQIMHRAGWDPHAMIEFMDVLRRQEGRAPASVEVFLSSHPAAAERASLLRAQLRGVSGGRRDSLEFRRVRARLGRLPPAHAMRQR